MRTEHEKVELDSVSTDHFFEWAFQLNRIARHSLKMVKGFAKSFAI